MGNSRGSYHSTLENKMAAYDKLPPTARKALQDAKFSWAVQPIVTRWNKGQLRTGAEIAAAIEKWDREQVIKTAPRTWGKEYIAIVVKK